MNEAKLRLCKQVLSRKLNRKQRGRALDQLLYVVQDTAQRDTLTNFAQSLLRRKDCTHYYHRSLAHSLTDEQAQMLRDLLLNWLADRPS